MQTRQKKIKNLGDLKRALSRVPTKILDWYMLAISEDGALRLSLPYDETERKEAQKHYDRDFKKYPEIKLIDMFFEKCGEEAQDEETECEPIEVNVRHSSQG